MAEFESEPVLTPGVEPTSGEAHSPPWLPQPGGTKGLNTSNAEWNDPQANTLPARVEDLNLNAHVPKEIPKISNRKRVVVAGLGMVGISFM